MIEKQAKTDFKMSKKYYLMGAIFLILASFFSVGCHHVDEHFQILEFAGLKLGLNTANNLPWEYHNQMRPGLQPAMVVVLYKFFALFNITNTPFLTLVLRFFSASLTFFTAHLLYKTFKKDLQSDTIQKWYLSLAFLLWVVVYNGVRFSSENWSGLLFCLGFATYYTLNTKEKLKFLLIGFLFGLSFLFRYQAAFLVFGFVLWLIFIAKEKLTNTFLVFLGILSMFLLGICIDRWFYGEWILTSWNYFAQNILEGKAADFGKEPFYWYFTGTIIKGVPPFSLLFVTTTLLLIIYKRKSALTWSIAPFIIIHSIIAHKELRFMFPIIMFLPIIAVQGLEIIQSKLKANFIESKFAKYFMKTIFVFNFIFLPVISIIPIDSGMYFLQKIYNGTDSETKLYFTEKDPFERVGLNVKFYRPKGLKCIKIASLNEVPNSKKSYIVLVKPNHSNNPKIGHLAFSSIPLWVLNFNINNWVERTDAWYVYAIKE